MTKLWKLQIVENGKTRFKCSFVFVQEVKTEEETEDTDDDHEVDPLETSSRIKQESILSTSSAPTLLKQVRTSKHDIFKDDLVDNFNLNACLIISWIY